MSCLNCRVVYCGICRLRKKPVGRAASLEMANSLCDSDCDGYDIEPFVGNRWPYPSDDCPFCTSRDIMTPERTATLREWCNVLHDVVWVNDDNAALVTDLYQLTMLQAYVAEGRTKPAVFDFFTRRLRDRNVLIACGMNDALAYIEQLRFSKANLRALRNLGLFSTDFLDYLADFRFTGDIYAVREGTPVFADEPWLEVIAPLPEAQLIETFLMTQVHHQTVMASKAARVVAAADGRTVVDFGLRRMHGADAGLRAARAFYIAGVDATSNVLAGTVHGIPVAGTMAHAYIQSHDDEYEAFRAFVAEFPDTVLLVDTYDTLAGVKLVIRLAKELGDKFAVRAIRLDSGDLLELSKAARQLLDDAGLSKVGIFASNSLDETEIAELLAAGAPITGFGVGTRLGVSEDQPALDTVYKLVEYDGEGRIKLAANKRTLPGRKQVYRELDADGMAVRDVVALADEPREGEPLLQCVMRDGVRVPPSMYTLDQSREHCSDQLARFPKHIRGLNPSRAYPIVVSDPLQAFAAEMELVVRGRQS